MNTGYLNRVAFTIRLFLFSGHRREIRKKNPMSAEKTVPPSGINVNQAPCSNLNEIPIHLSSTSNDCRPQGNTNDYPFIIVFVICRSIVQRLIQSFLFACLSLETYYRQSSRQNREEKNTLPGYQTNTFRPYVSSFILVFSTLYWFYNVSCDKLRKRIVPKQISYTIIRNLSSQVIRK